MTERFLQKLGDLGSGSNHMTFNESILFLDSEVFTYKPKRLYKHHL